MADDVILRSVPVAHGQESLLADLRARIALQASRLVEAEAKLEEHEAEIARLRREAAETQAAADMNAAWRQELEEHVAELRRNLIVQVRANRMTAAAAAHEREQAAAAREELARLRPEVERWRNVQLSRSYRITRAYVRVYSLPVAGRLLRLLRRPAGKVWRTIRNR